MIINFSNIGSGTGGGGSYTLPVASANELGGVKIGQGISIDQDGVISAQGGKNDIVIDVAEVDNMSYADREVLWDEVYEKILAGHRIYAKGEVRGETGYYAYLPLEKYKAETNTSAHIGGFLFFAVKDKDENIYLRFNFSSAGNLNWLDSDSRLLKYKIYSLPTASSNTLGGVKIGSGISIDENGVISAQGGGATDLTIRIDSGGTINTNLSSLGALSSLNSFGRIRFSYYGDNQIVGDGALLSFHRKIEQIDGQDKLVEYITGLCGVEGVVYKGTWHFIENEYGEAIAPDTWAAFS